MPVVHQFAYGVANPIIAIVMAFVGGIFGLTCTSRATKTSSQQLRIRWLVFGAIALGAIGAWLTHFIAMLGFDVSSSPVRYGIAGTLLSVVIIIVPVGLGLQIAGVARPTAFRTLIGGLLIGGGISAMHFAGMAASRINGHFAYNTRIVAASIVIGVVGSVIALWLTVMTRSYAAVVAGSVVFAVTVACMHYTAMYALTARLSASGEVPAGVGIFTMVIPMVILGTLTLLGMLFAALNMMTDDDIRLTVDRAAMDGGTGANAQARTPAPVVAESVPWNLSHEKTTTGPFGTSDRSKSNEGWRDLATGTGYGNSETVHRHRP